MDGFTVSRVIVATSLTQIVHKINRFMLTKKAATNMITATKLMETPMGRLTTHVLDTAQGCPGAGMHLALFSLSGGARTPLRTLRTNSDGRCDKPLLEGADFLAGEYELVFQAGDYFKSRSVALPDPPFLNEVVLRFGIADAGQHYHVPLLVSPWSYSTYRGS